ncbi:hypothetical protein F5B22DRAFT_530257 [Xylaria bambusicola]|uniref:uncharacterized protein n=1 Tax=Xylaria bambusicola TaxID=326684 RepID=UPI00200725FA|nr:uncharacterized protein F5B22DRAFT_530257 [Xylaria bambusicola]KAI0505249.1 hypothetical protein F5B22DRAFT_530257 [Xylaria bambusicola]
MTSHDMPNWIRILLLILTYVSFVPQLCHLARRRGNASGINLGYVLINLVAATELFTLILLIALEFPLEAGSWIDFVNLAIIWILWLAIFLICIMHHWHENCPSTSHFIAFYAFLLIISVMPIILDAIVKSDPNYEPSFTEAVYIAIYFIVHIYIIIPIIIILSFVAYFLQARQIMARPPESSADALSVVGVAFQVVVFSVLAATWYPGRLNSGSSKSTVLDWRIFGGCIPINHAVFAVEQALVLITLWCRRRGERRGNANLPDETQPLIGSQQVLSS